MTSPKRSILKAGVATAIGVAILVALGSWQLARLAWKNELVGRVGERMADAPVPAPPKADWPTLPLDAWSYRRVRLEGRFDHAKEARVYVNLPDAKGRFRGPGFFILTPLAMAGGAGTVLVNRGFAPDHAEGVARPEGEVALTGALREPEAKNLFTPADDPAKKLFFARDPKAIAAGLGLVEVAPFTVDAEATGAPGGLPQGGETRVTFPNRHLEYALTWYGLAAALIAVFFAVAWRTLREGPAAEGPR